MTTRLVHVQTVLREKDLIDLKLKTGQSTTKDALAEAVLSYLSRGVKGGGK